MRIKLDAKAVEHDIAREILTKFKKKETKKKRHTWMGQGLIVTHGSLIGLREMVEDAGYDWSKGSVDTK